MRGWADVTPDQLAELEAIKQLKARYFRLMDLQRWDEWQIVFTEGAEMRIGSVEPVVLRGREEIVASAKRNLATRVTAHHGHTPELSLVDGKRATGIWTAQMVGAPRPGSDDLTPPMQSFGHYLDGYVKANGRWWIDSVQITTVLRVTSDPAAHTHLTGGSDDVVIPSL